MSECINVCKCMRSSLKPNVFFSQCTRNVIFKNGFSRFVYKNSKIHFNVYTFSLICRSTLISVIVKTARGHADVQALKSKRTREKAIERYSVRERKTPSIGIKIDLRQLLVSCPHWIEYTQRCTCVAYVLCQPYILRISVFFASTMLTMTMILWFSSLQRKWARQLMSCTPYDRFIFSRLFIQISSFALVNVATRSLEF